MEVNQYGLDTFVLAISLSNSALSFNMNLSFNSWGHLIQAISKIGSLVRSTAEPSHITLQIHISPHLDFMGIALNPGV